jgi:hypothetical protein
LLSEVLKRVLYIDYNMHKNGRPKRIPQRIPDEKNGFRTAILLGGSILGGSVATGAWIGHIRGTKRIEASKRFENAAEKMGDFATEYLRRSSAGLPLENFDKQHFITLVKNNLGADVKSAEFFWQYIISKREMYEEGKQIAFYIPKGHGDSESARKEALNTFITGSAIGLAHGLVLFVILNRIFTVARFERLKKASRKAFEDAMRKRDEQRNMQKRRMMEKNAIQVQMKTLLTESDIVPECVRDADRDKKMELRFALRTMCGRVLTREIYQAIWSCIPNESLERFVKGETKIETLLLENNEQLNIALKSTGWNVEKILVEIEKRNAVVLTSISHEKEEEIGSQSMPTKSIDKKISKSLEILRLARENSRGLDRKGLREIIKKTGFEIVGAAGGGGHLQILYEGIQVRNAYGRIVVIPHKSSGGLPCGTVIQILDNLTYFFEKMIESENSTLPPSH